MFFYYLTLLLMPFDNHPLLSYNYQGITPIKIVGGIAMLFALLELAGYRKRVPVLSLPQNKYFIVFSVLFILSTLINSSVFNSVAFLRYFSIFMFFITTVILVNTKERFVRSIVMLLFSLGVASLYMFREYSLYGSIYEGYRPGGILNDPNYSALAILTVAPIAFFLFKNTQKKYARFFFFSMMCLYIGAILLSQSRGGYIALAVVLLMILFNIKAKLKTCIIGGLIILLIAWVLPVDIGKRLGGEDAGAQVSTESRYALLVSGVRMFLDNPFFGVGPGQFKQYSDHYADISKKQIAHNSYIELAAELGIIGLIVFILICKRTLKDISRAMVWFSGDPVPHAMITGIRIGLTGYLVGAIFLSAEYENILWLYIFIIAAVVSFAGIEHQNIIVQKSTGDNSIS